jgi:SAM-dependent methyltransferase
LLERILKKILRKLEPDPSAVLQERIYAEFARALTLNPILSERLALPEGYGQGLPERAVELLLAWLTLREGGEILDVGYANAMPCHRMMLRQAAGHAAFTGGDIAPPAYDASEFYAKTIQADITKVPLPPESFDVIWCISLLEHVGMDNSGYTGNFSRQSNMDSLAVQEMIRLLRTGGKLLITVPYGKFEDHGWFRNYDAANIERLMQGIGLNIPCDKWFFRHTFGSGWAQAKPEELQYVGYYDQGNCGASALAAIILSK